MKPSKPIASSRKLLRPSSEPSQLAELQRLMARAVMRPLTASERMQARWMDGQTTSEIASGFIKPNDRLTSFDRLEIYNRQYWFRLLDCLHDDYPGLRAVLGDARFLRLSIAYLNKYPSSCPDLRNLGSRLVKFIEEEPSFVQPHARLAHDMARLEWAQVVAFDGETRRVAALKHPAGIAPDKIFLRLQPYITLLDLRYPADQIVVRLLHKEGELRSEASNAVESPSSRPLQRSMAHRIKPARTRLLVHRHENSVYFKNLSEPEYNILRALDSGASLLAAVEAVEKFSIPPQQVQSWFQTWTALGFLVRP